MNAKYALALILALQVSMSLCEIPAPSQDLVDKYEEMRGTFYKRLLTAYGKAQAYVAPLVEKVGESERGQAARDYVEDMQTKPEFQAFVKVATAVGQELGPLVDKLRTAMLGVYGHYVRPYTGQYVSDAIDYAKGHLDRHMPTE